MIVCLSGINAQLNELDSLLDDILFINEDIPVLPASETTFHFVYGGTKFDSKTFYAGREVGTDQFNLSGQLFYFNSKGFYIGTAGAWYSQVEPKYSTTVLSAGYSKGLKANKNIRYRASYNRFFYNTNNSDYSPTYTSSINLGTTLKRNWAGTRLDLTCLIGNEYGASVSWDIYSKIKLLKFGKYNKIQFEPEISMYFSSETVEYDSYYYLNDYLGSEPISDYYTQEVFGLMNTQIQLPVSLSYKKFDFELGYIVNVPRSLDKNYYYDKSSYINLSIGYIISFMK